MICKVHTKQFWVKKLVILTFVYLLPLFSVYGAEKRDYSEETQQKFPLKTTHDIIIEAKVLCDAAHAYQNQGIKDSRPPETLLKEAFRLVKSINVNDHDLEDPTNLYLDNPVSLLKYISEELKKKYKEILELGKSTVEITKSIVEITKDEIMKRNKAASAKDGFTIFRYLRGLGEFMQKETEFEEFLQNYKDEAKIYTDLSLDNYLTSLTDEESRKSYADIGEVILPQIPIENLWTIHVYEEMDELYSKHMRINSLPKHEYFIVSCHLDLPHEHSNFYSTIFIDSNCFPLSDHQIEKISSDLCNNLILKRVPYELLGKKLYRVVDNRKVIGDFFSVLHHMNLIPDNVIDRIIEFSQIDDFRQTPNLLTRIEQ